MMDRYVVGPPGRSPPNPGEFTRWSSVVCFLGSSSEGSVNGGFIGAYDGELDGTLRE